MLIRIVLGLCAALIACSLTGCYTVSTTAIDAHDSSVFIPSGRLTVDFSRQGETPSEPHRGHALELAYSGASGSATQTLGSGQPPVNFGGQTFSPPQQLTHEFDFRFFEVAYRYRNFFGTGDLGIEALGGIANAHLDLAVSSPTRRASETLNSMGAVGGFGLIWRLRPTTSLQARYSVFVSGEKQDVTNVERLDLYLAQSLGRNVAVRGGLATWKVKSAREESNNSEINLRFSGPALGLELMF